MILWRCVLGWMPPEKAISSVLFWWDETLEGFDYWQMVWAGDIPEAEWRPKVDAMIAQWEAEKN